jgi:hypothetical protein
VTPPGVLRGEKKKLCGVSKRTVLLGCRSKLGVGASLAWPVHHFRHHDSYQGKTRGHSKKEDILDTMIQLKLRGRAAARRRNGA